MMVGAKFRDCALAMRDFSMATRWAYPVRMYAMSAFSKVDFRYRPELPCGGAVKPLMDMHPCERISPTQA